MAKVFLLKWLSSTRSRSNLCHSVPLPAMVRSITLPSPLCTSPPMFGAKKLYRVPGSFCISACAVYTKPG
jgi:hypothetical protein